MIKYYDIGLNLFCKQFRDSERIIQEAEESGVCCILTGTDPKENKTGEAGGFCFHGADSFRKWEDCGRGGMRP